MHISSSIHGWQINNHLISHRHIPIEESIDLLNVAFENPRKIRNKLDGNLGGLPKRQKRAMAHTQKILEQPLDTSYMVPDRVTGLQEVEELRRLCPGRIWNFVGLSKVISL